MAERIVVDVRVGLVGAVGPGHDLSAEPLGRVVDREVHGLLDRLDAVALDDLGQARGAVLGRADLGADVADEPRQPHIGRHRVEEVAAFLPLVDDLDSRPADALGPDLGRVDVVAAGAAATGVAVVALDRGNADEPPVDDDRRVDVVVGQVTATVVRIVGGEHVAGPPLVLLEEVEGKPDRQGRGQHELGDADTERGEPAVAVEDGGVALVGLVEDRRGRSPRHVGGHLEADGLHRVADDLCGDGVDLALGVQAVAMGRQGHAVGRHASPWRSVAHARLPCRASSLTRVSGKE